MLLAWTSHSFLAGTQLCLQGTRQLLQGASFGSGAGCAPACIDKLGGLGTHERAPTLRAYTNLKSLNPMLPTTPGGPLCARGR